MLPGLGSTRQCGVCPPVRLALRVLLVRQPYAFFVLS